MDKISGHTNKDIRRMGFQPCLQNNLPRLFYLVKQKSVKKKKKL